MTAYDVDVQIETRRKMTEGDPTDHGAWQEPGTPLPRGMKDDDEIDTDGPGLGPESMVWNGVVWQAGTWAASPGHVVHALRWRWAVYDGQPCPKPGARPLEPAMTCAYELKPGESGLHPEHGLLMRRNVGGLAPGSMIPMVGVGKENAGRCVAIRTLDRLDDVQGGPPSEVEWRWNRDLDAAPFDVHLDLITPHKEVEQGFVKEPLDGNEHFPYIFRPEYGSYRYPEDFVGWRLPIPIVFIMEPS